MNAASIRSQEVTASGLRFEVDLAGEPTAPLVLLLHGFPQTSHTYRDQLPALAAAGYFAVAPNQRGYSPGARPAGVEHYTTELLVADALHIADALGAQHFHLVGHDWGGQLAWLLAANHAERVETLSVLSRPHPAAFARALREDAAQSERSRHHRAFQDPDTAKRLLADGAQRLRRALTEQGVASADVDAYLRRLSDEAALDAALNWYRATAPRPTSSAATTATTATEHSPSSALARDVAAVRVPTLYVWGDADKTVGRAAAIATAQYVTAPYRFEIIPGAGHFLTDQVGETITRLLLEHLAR
jgi:pimeloyl-ACP methyl ester carboxylesterase